MSGATQVLVKLLATEATGDLLVLFHKNPGLIDTIDGVARRIGKTGLDVESDVKILVDLGLLKRRKIGSSEVVSLDRQKDREIQETVAKHLMNDREGRNP